LTVHPRRSLSARRAAVLLAIDLIQGRKSIKNLRESEKTELVQCLEQAHDFLSWAVDHQGQLETVAKARAAP